MTSILETERLQLREVIQADLPVLHQIFSDPESMRYYPSAKSFEETVTWFEKLAFRSYREHGFGLWAIVEKTSGEVIGDCGITIQPTSRGLEPEIGYHLRREYLGRGYAYEAASACLDHGFGTLALDRIVSIVSPENKPSQRVAARVHQRWEIYQTTTKAGLEVDRLLFISEKGRDKSSGSCPNAETRIAMVEPDVLALMRQGQT
ncbi:GNAT family N-acetyltransferase [Rhizobium sp. XQZ8]|uniref:GNAT family N-acetyltransferase n=1 Tax=Rhizobium populisoli TaxID=2859785 RepID=UPI001C683365|nr:GNAT family N-acetyltransferase [Rhizobium populisoli]MBW6421431.1 GNAT family N-acetyltransferase [Rhizobium populisoli]